MIFCVFAGMSARYGLGVDDEAHAAALAALGAYTPEHSH
jgi:hypothetical protein